MYALVDYANLQPQLRQLGPDGIALRLVNLLGATHLEHKDRVLDVRLYSGWYEDRMLTRSAQELSVQILNSFPTVCRINGQPLRVSCSLALSTLAVPHSHLFHTYRQRSVPWSIRCKDLSETECREGSSCPWGEMPAFVSRGKCHVSQCSVGPRDLLFRGEQKMVDCMIAVDLMYIAATGGTSAAVVTADDDLWPAIIAAQALGLKMIVDTLHRDLKNVDPSLLAGVQKDSLYIC